MEIRSEKERYYSEFIDITRDLPYDDFLWGEELIDMRIVVYPKKIKDIPGYEEIKNYLINCGLIVMDFAKLEYMRFTSTRLDTKNKRVYICENVFNSCWQDLKKSVGLGIRLAKEKDENIVVDTEDEIVDLSYLSSNRRVAYIENDRILYRGIEISDEEKRKLGRRQSLLDNAKMKFYFSTDGGYVHDKNCEKVMQICIESFDASDMLPDNRELCPLCKRKILLRMACDPYVKQIPNCDWLLKKVNVSNSKLEKIVMIHNMKFNYQSASEFYIKCNEDSWMIDASNLNNIRLFHNNYSVIDDTRRSIESGYHNQKMDGHSFNSMLNYISDYSWEKHLESKKKQESVVDKNAIPVAIERKVGMIERFTKYIKRLFKIN